VRWTIPPTPCTRIGFKEVGKKTGTTPLTILIKQRE
jgi:hypothetical protein